MKREVFLAAYGGVFFSFIGDLIGGRNSNSISELFGKKLMEVLHIPGGIPACYALLVFLLIISVVLYIEQPIGRKEGFVRGLAVLSIINLSGLKSVDTEPTTQASEKIQVVAKLTLLPEWHSNTKGFHDQNFTPIRATIEETPEWVSSTKPEVTFIGGLLNTINTTPRNLYIKPGTIVTILEYFDTPNRGNRYARIKVSLADGKDEEVWIPAGQREWNKTLHLDK